MGKIKEGLYRCVCGREFEKAQSYNAHLSGCRLNLGEERWEARIEKNKLSLDAGRSKFISNCKDKKDKLRLEWNSTDHYCKNCGNKIMYDYDHMLGEGLYCSRSCANSRKHSIDTLKKIAANSNINGKAGRSLNGYYRGYYCASSYELIYLVYCLDHNINIERNKYTFTYNYEGKDHAYNPDWYLPDTNTIIECKGKGINYDKEIVKLKADSVDKKFNYRILYEEDLKEYWEYCKEVYKVKTYKQLCKLLYV